MSRTDFDDLEVPLGEGPADTREVLFTEKCPKCAGTGQFRGYTGRSLGKCFACGGKGVLEFKTDPHKRAQARVAATTRKETAKAGNWETFKAEHVAASLWIEERRASFDFAQAMFDAIAKYGSLTANQMATVERLMAQGAARKVEQVAKAAVASEIDVTRITGLFTAARKNLLKKPILRVGEVTLSLAGEHSKNPGSVYVKRGETYLGKISETGLYSPSREATAEDIETVKATAANPLELAVAYGRRTGNCACCGRMLTDPVSVERGIGPICAGNWGL
jgi:hypothetical protein